MGVGLEEGWWGNGTEGMGGVGGEKCPRSLGLPWGGMALGT